MDEFRYGNLVFDKSLLSAGRAGNKGLRFTRQERALLDLFTRNAGRLLSRARILDAISFSGSDISDRNVDFLVNRLRTKLGDDARAPRFIATQYGEGYIWIAKPAESVEAFLVIGPCHGMRHEETAARARPVLAGLAEALDKVTGQHGIVVKPDWSADPNAGGAVSYSLDASLHADGRGLHGAFVLRDGRSGQILEVFRAIFPGVLAEEVRDLARHIADAIWAHLALPAPAPPAPAHTPLELRMHDAALLLARTPESWQKSREQIEKARAGNPDDPALAVMQGLALYAGLVQRFRSPEEWRETEAEIEALVLDSLPAIQDNPLLMLGAAKLLFFIERGHFELANRIAVEAFDKSTAFAAAFATRAQLRMAEGAFCEGHLLYDKAVELSEPGSEFLVYLKVLKITAALAAGDRGLADALMGELCAIKPVVRAQIGLVVASPDADLPADLAALLQTFDAEAAQALLFHFYNTSARHFHAAAQRRNVMRGLITHVTRRLGDAVVPDPVRAGLDD